MDAHDDLEVRHVHLGERLVAQHARVVDQNVDPPPVLFRARRHRQGLLEIPDVRRVGHGGSARGADLLDDREGALRRRAVAAEIVDDDLRAARGEPQRVTAAEARRPRP